MTKHLEKPGEYDYDLRNDIFFFKVKDREYSHSVELNNFVIDFDEEDFIVGLQIFHASEFFKLAKEVLRQVKGFKMNAKIDGGEIQVNLGFMSVQRNKTIHHSPTLVTSVSPESPNTNVISVMA
ncbi:MAG TPA: DUF2283 domain-containing protein [Candidatus Pacearchaeota archaeon]|nr:DUF2283 domain-containing protein [Candidatus Pacearchaeota archaeon]